MRVIVSFENERMRAKGVGEYTRAPRAKSGVLRRTKSEDTMVRLQPETYERLAVLRHPLVDPEGRLVAFESFDRTVRRLLDERRADGTSDEQLRRTEP